MTSLPPTRKPVFLWQAGLILLPVLIIAAVALTAIVENRTEVERDARLRAEEVARQYGRQLEQHLGSVLVEHDLLSAKWADYLAEVHGGWPGSARRAQVETEWHPPPDPPYPGWQAADVYPDRFALTPDGRFADGLEFDPAPQPPSWLAALSPAQRGAWEALNSAAGSGAETNEIQRRLVAFEVTGPPPAATLNAEFIGLRARLTLLPPAAAVTEALRFTREGAMLANRQTSPDGVVTSVTGQMPSARELRETLSEAGLPLVNLAFAQALRYAGKAGPSEQLWNAIPGQVLHAPSPLTPALLDQLEAIAGTNTALHTGVAAWRTLWNARLKLYDIADAVRQTGKWRGAATTNLWIEHDQTRWLCLLNPEPTSLPRTVNAAPGEPANGVWTVVRFLPKPVLEQALARELEGSAVRLPSYLGLAASLAGEPLNLPERWCPTQSVRSAAPMLAQATGALSATSKLQAAPGAPDTDYEMLPSRPRFVLQLYVADRALLLSSYWRHTMLLAGLVAASGFAALIGVITSWRAFRRQLRLNELKSNFVSSVSHELRSPIASVRLMAESLERGKVTEAPKQHEYFRFIVQECRRLSSLIENVLDFSRIDQGRKQYDFEPTDLVALTQQTVKLMETYAAERNVNLQLQLLPDPQPSTLNSQLPPNQLPNYQLAADGKALQQALVNLIDNALKHSPKGDTVLVGLENQKSQIQNPPSLLLWVEDHGEGIPAAEHDRIFERFYRRGSELRRQTQGVGIGLSIVKHIVEAHGGRVLVRSAVGQGSRFTIELPVLPTPTKSEARNPKPE